MLSLTYPEAMSEKSKLLHSPMGFLGVARWSREIRPINLEGEDVPIWIKDWGLISIRLPEPSPTLYHSNALCTVITPNEEKAFAFSHPWHYCNQPNKTIRKSRPENLKLVGYGVSGFWYLPRSWGWLV